MDLDIRQCNETIGIYYLPDPGVTSNKNFSFITRLSIPILRFLEDRHVGIPEPELALSADGSKFAMALYFSRVSVWDIQSKVPFKPFMGVPKSNHHHWPIQYLQFSSGKSRKKALVFVEVCMVFTF